MELKKQHYFRATLSKIRKGLEKENIELYSLNGSFKEDVLWKITACPTYSYSVKGFVEKLEGGKPVKCVWKEAEPAIYGTFLEVSDLSSCRPFDTKKPKKLNSIAFTLRVESYGQDELKAHQQIQMKTDEYLLETGNIKVENVVANIHGILTLLDNEDSEESESDLSDDENSEERKCKKKDIEEERMDEERYSLVQCAEILAEVFPKRMITWLSYCYSPQGYKHATFNLQTDEKIEGF